MPAESHTETQIRIAALELRLNTLEGCLIGPADQLATHAQMLQALLERVQTLEAHLLHRPSPGIGIGQPIPRHVSRPSTSATD